MRLSERLKISISILLFILPLPSLSLGSWTVETVDNSGLAGKYTSITLDSGFEPHISYSSNGNSILYYASHASGVWVTETVESGTSAGFTSISADSFDSFHISYGGVGYRYATNSSGVWVAEAMKGSDVLVPSTSLKVDALDVVHIGHFSAPTSGISLEYTTDASGDWVTETVDDTGLGLGPASSSIAVDSEGTVHMGYSNNGSVRYAVKPSGSWLTETIDSGQYASLAVDAWGYGHLGYYDNTNGNLRYATNASGSWVIETVDSAGDVGQYASVTADPGGNAHIVYYDASNGNLKYAANASGSWVIETVDSAGDVGQYASLAVDPICRMHTSFYDNTNRFLKYASRTSFITFSDVSQGFWAEDYISAHGCNEITTGCGGGNYCPNNNVTRAEMAAFLVRAVEGEPAGDYCGTTDPFNDVPFGHWACRYIKRLSELGITTGCGGGNYCPNSNVTRAEMAAFLARAFLGLQ